MQISTVTYLTRDGSPTIVLDCAAHTQYAKLKRSDISRAWVSFPCPQKHMSFDGRLLHGAPALHPLPPSAVRVTFLANVRVVVHLLLLSPASASLPSSRTSGLAEPSPPVAAAAALFHRKAPSRPSAVTCHQHEAQRLLDSHSRLLIRAAKLFIRPHWQ